MCDRVMKSVSDVARYYNDQFGVDRPFNYDDFERKVKSSCKLLGIRPAYADEIPNECSYYWYQDIDSDVDCSRPPAHRLFSF